MPPIGDPTPIDQADDTGQYQYDARLRELFAASQNLSLLQRDGAIQHGDKAGNLDAKYCVFTSNGTANTEDAITHNLGHVPNGYIVVNQDKAASLYRSQSTLGTITSIYWKSSAASVAWTVLVF